MGRGVLRREVSPNKDAFSFLTQLPPAGLTSELNAQPRLRWNAAWSSAIPRSEGGGSLCPEQKFRRFQVPGFPQVTAEAPGLQTPSLLCSPSLNCFWPLAEDQKQNYIVEPTMSLWMLRRLVNQVRLFPFLVNTDVAHPEDGQLPSHPPPVTA